MPTRGTKGPSSQSARPLASVTQSSLHLWCAVCALYLALDKMCLPWQLRPWSKVHGHQALCSGGKRAEGAECGTESGAPWVVLHFLHPWADGCPHSPGLTSQLSSGVHVTVSFQKAPPGPLTVWPNGPFLLSKQGVVGLGRGEEVVRTINQ